MKLSDIVEPLPVGRAWNRGDHSERQTIQCRPSDMSVMYALMQGSGVRNAAFAIHLFQIGLAIRAAMLNPDQMEDDPFWHDLGAAIARIIKRQELEPGK